VDIKTVALRSQVQNSMRCLCVLRYEVSNEMTFDLHIWPASPYFGQAPRPLSWVKLHSHGFKMLFFQQRSHIKQQKLSIAKKAYVNLKL